MKTRWTQFGSSGLHPPPFQVTTALEIGLLALLYFVTARLGQLLAIPPGNITPVWIPSGIILAAVLIRGYRVWPGIFLGAFAGNVWAYFSTESLGAMLRCVLAGTANGIGDTLCAVVGAYLITRTTGRRDPFTQPGNVLKFIAFGVVLGSGVSALFGVTALGLAGFVPWHNYLPSLSTWWTGDAVGILVITPMLLVWQAGWRGCRFGQEELLFAMLLPSTSLVGWLLVPAVPALAVVPLLLWAVFRFDRRVVFAALFLQASLITVLTALGTGPFGIGKSSGALVNLQLFVMVISMPMLVFCTAMAESVRVRDQLQKLKHELEQRVRDQTERLLSNLVEQQRLVKPADEPAGSPRSASLRWAGLFVLLVGLISIAVATYYTQRIVNATAKREFRFDIQEIQNRISSRIAAQEQVLRSGAAFLAHATGISRQEWRRFVERQNVAQPLTGIQGVGFARLIPHERLAQHIQEVRAEGFPDYQVRPAGERENYSTIVYLEPFASRNLLAFGYDMLTEPVRRVAMERARDLDVATLSGKVKLVQETDEDIQAGTLMYVPVYGAGMPIATVDQRRAALQGWIYSPYRMTDLMRGILGQWDSITDRRIRLEIFDGESPVPAALLYDSQPAEVRPQETAEALISQRPLVVAGRQWGLRFSKTADSTASTAYLRIWLTLFGGTCVSLLLCGLVFALVETQLTTKQSAQRSAAELRQREAQTLASAQLLQAIIDHSQCLTYAKDIEGRHILASQPLAKLFGLQSSEQVLGKTLHDFLPPAMADQLRANDLAVVARRSPLQTEEITESPDGPRVFLSTKFPIFDALDRVIAVCGVSFDITHLRRIEDALRESEAHYRSLFDNMLNGLAYCQMLYEQERPSDFIYLSVNPAFQASTGLKDVVGKKISEVIPGICEADPELFEILGRVARTGAPDNFEIYLQSLQMWFAISAYQPAPDHFVAVFEVITQRKQAELATSRLAAIVASSDDAIIGKDLDGVITTWNQGAEKIFGYTASEMIGVSIMRLIPADRQQEEDQILAKIQRGEGINHFETLRQAKDGRLIDVSITSSPIRDAQGRVFGVSKVARDITKRKQAEAVLRRQAEELQARNDELERFNRVMMDREMRVIDLKQKINALAEELGQPQHYSMRFLDPANGELHRAAGSPDRGGDSLSPRLHPQAAGDKLSPPLETTQAAGPPTGPPGPTS